MRVETVINQVRKYKDCRVFPTAGLPNVSSGHVIPEDLIAFYRKCGGILLFRNSTFPTTIMPPDKFTLANPVIFDNLVSEEMLSSSTNDISWSWYLIGVGPNSQFITIDLDAERLGHCYNSFWINHPRDSFIIAKSFTELLEKLLETKGDYYYWDVAGFKSPGNPYESI